RSETQKSRRTVRPTPRRRSSSTATGDGAAAVFLGPLAPDVQAYLSKARKARSVFKLGCVLTFPPSAAKRLKQRDRVGKTIGLSCYKRNARLLIGALRIKQRQIINSARLETFLRDLQA